MVERRLLAIMFAILVLVSAAALIAMLSGCAGALGEVAMPAEVELPIAVPPAPCIARLPARPALPLAALAPDAAPADTVRAYAATVALLKGAVAERDALLGGCMALPAPVLLWERARAADPPRATLPRRPLAEPTRGP